MFCFKTKAAGKKWWCELFLCEEFARFLCEEGGVCYACACVFDDDGTVPTHCISHHHVLQRTDSVALMEADLEMLGVESQPTSQPACLSS